MIEPAGVRERGGDRSGVKGGKEGAREMKGSIYGARACGSPLNRTEILTRKQERLHHVKGSR